MEQQEMPHSLQLKQRHQLSITGVSEVVSFDDSTVVLQTAMGTLIVQGQQLQLKTLSVEGGEVRVEGTITALVYEEPRPKGGWWQRLLG